jgi:hypothetical protein
MGQIYAFDESVSEACTEVHAYETGYCMSAHFVSVSEALHTSPKCMIITAESLDY